MPRDLLGAAPPRLFQLPAWIDARMLRNVILALNQATSSSDDESGDENDNESTDALAQG
jgi:hypothetical protein